MSARQGGREGGRQAGRQAGREGRREGESICARVFRETERDSVASVMLRG